VLHETGALDIPDDRSSVNAGDHVVLIVDNDENFARFLLDMSHEYGMKGIATPRGADAVSLARERAPDAITLDINLPDIDGWRVLRRLKEYVGTRHIPIHVISTRRDLEPGLRRGARAVLQKPADVETIQAALVDMRRFIDRPAKELLLVQADEAERRATLEFIGNGDVHTMALASGKEAIAALGTQHFDCVVVDPQLPDMSGLELIEDLMAEQAHPRVPVIVYTKGELEKKDALRLRRLMDV